MSEENSSTNPIYAIINDFYLKYKDEKFKLSRFQKFLSERNNSLEDFYLRLMDELELNLENINNLIKTENFFSEYKEDTTFHRILEIISESNNIVKFSEKNNSIVEEKIISSFDLIFTILVKIGVYMEKQDNLNNVMFKQLVDKFIKKIIRIMKVLYEKDYQCIEDALESSEYNEYLMKALFTRNILYDILTSTISNINNEEEIKRNRRGSLALSINIIKYLIKEINISNITDIIQDIENILFIYKECLLLIEDFAITLLKKIIDLYNPEGGKMKYFYENLFSFCFNEIVFKENSKQKYNNKFIEILFKLYIYLLEKDNKPIIEIFLIKLFLSLSDNFLNNDTNKNSFMDRYEWLLNETEYKKVILVPLPILINDTIFQSYFLSLKNMMNPANKQKGIFPEEDFIIFVGNFEKYLNNSNFTKKYFITTFTSKICELMKYNVLLVKTVLQKCNFSSIIIKLINEEKENNIKIKLMELLENIVSLNTENYNYTFEFEITKDISDDINNRMNKFAVWCEPNNEKYNKKIGELISINAENIKENKILEFIDLSKIMFDIIISEYQFKKINALSEDNLINLNNEIQQLSDIFNNPDTNEMKNKQKDLDEYVYKFINMIIQFIFRLNNKNFDYKLKKNNLKKNLYFTKRIIKKKTLKYIIKNLLLSKNDLIRQKTLDYILFISIDEENNLIISSYFLYIVLNIYYQEKDYENIGKLINVILNLIKKFEINIQILFYFDFLTIILNILEELIGKENEHKECYNSTFSLLKELSKYLNPNLLINYLNKVFILFKKNVLNQIQNQEEKDTLPSDKNEINQNSPSKSENNNDAPKEEIKNINNNYVCKLCFDLLELLKSNFNYDKEKYLILSNYTFPNHLINNALFLDNLKFKDESVFDIGFKITIKINSSKGLNGFNLLKLIQRENSICFQINNNCLVIKEIYEKSETIINKIDNFDTILYPDDKYHIIIVNFSNMDKTFEMFVDNKLIITKNTSVYKNSISGHFNGLIGFSNDLINCDIKYLDNKLNKNNNNEPSKNEDIAFIYISHLLFINTSIEEKIYKNGKFETLNPSLLNYCLNKDNINFGKFIISEIDFQNENNIISLSKTICNKVAEINHFFYLENYILANRYISCKRICNNLNLELPESFIYMISKNNNLGEFCSLNSMWELQKINKSNIESKLFDNYNTKNSLNVAYIIDFLFGFFFLIEKRLNELKNQAKDNNGQNNEQIECNLNISNENENTIIDYISEILDFIFLFPPDTILEYFSENNIFKLKYFIYRNIELFKNAKNLGNKILDKFSKMENLSVIFISDIFLDINIFEELNSIVQNEIINYLYKFLEKIDKKENKENKEMLFCFNKLIISCLNIIFFTDLSSEIKEENTNFDLLIKFIYLTISKLALIKLDEKENKDTLGKIFYEMNNIYSDFEKEFRNHLNKEMYKKYNYIFSGNDEEYKEGEGYLEKKLVVLSIQIKKYYNYFSKNENIILLMDNYIKKNYKIVNKKECSFCAYINKLFYLRSKFIYEENNYVKLFNRFFRNYYQNFGDNPDIFRKNNYAWFLSLKESRSKTQNKFFLKENLIKDMIYKSPKTDVKTLYYKYMIDEQKYKHKFKQLNKLHFYDKICTHDKLISTLYPSLDLEENNHYNCLILNKLRKILSVFILYKDRIVIYTNICLDENDNIHIVKEAKTSNVLWMKNQKEFMDEFKTFIEENEKQIKKDFYEKKEIKKDAKPKLSKFNYNKSYKFNRKVIYLNKINEIHKRNHLHIPNSLEIFLENGENYYIVFIPEIRELIFDKIISNIDDIYKSKQENKIPIFKSQKIQNLTNKENIFYMKHTPLEFLPQSEVEHFFKNNKIKKNLMTKPNIKCILDGNAFKEDICNYWSKNRISNYDYIILLNTLAGRSLSNLSQYFIFPWIIKDFNSDILNWTSNSIYRDLSIPIYACGGDFKKIKENFDILDEDQYHSGTFYSTHNFVCYYLVRLHPFTEIHIEIQGARFDAKPRMFNGTRQLSELKEKPQELIPQIYYLPELFLKLNYVFEDIESDEGIISDFILPSWSKDDPRKFTLILKKLLESEKVSKHLNRWIDLIFGYQQRGPNAEKALNTYRDPVNFPNEKKLEDLVNFGEIESYLYEKEELGCVGKQLFTKQHKSKENINENIKSKMIFFNSDEKMKQIIIEKLKDESNLLKKISFSKYNDIIFPDNYALNNIRSKSCYQGGISSISNIINISEEQIKTNLKKEKKLIKSLDEDNNVFILKNNYYFLSKFCLILTYNNKFIEIINIKENECKFYLLMENAEISCLTINSKGTKIFVGFSNGFINQYNVIKIPLNLKNVEDSYIEPKFQFLLDENLKVYNDIFFINDDYFKMEGTSNAEIYLKLIKQNNFNDNNPHLYNRINLLEINESHNVLIALDKENIIYIMSLNNNYKLMHKISFLSKHQIKMKEIIPLPENGDFIIYSSYTVNLFSINGVPLCSLSLFDKEYEELYSITCCKAVFIYDVILFTAHKDGSIIIWKMLNKDTDEILSSDNNQKEYLKEYMYGYNYRNYNSGIKLSEVNLRRKFVESCRTKITEENNNYCTFMKISNDLDFMVLLDNERNMYIMTNSDKDINIKKKGTVKIKSKLKCMNCGKEITDSGIKLSLVQTVDANGFDVINKMRD